jgi:hypothetical protein
LYEQNKKQRLIMKKILLAILLCAVMTGAAWAWDNRGHATIARIAERHLTPRAKANIEKYLDGQSFVYYASWMDFNRHKPPFDITRDWHVDYWTDDMRTDAEGNPLPPVSIEQTSASSPRWPTSARSATRS